MLGERTARLHPSSPGRETGRQTGPAFQIIGGTQGVGRSWLSPGLRTPGRKLVKTPSGKNKITWAFFFPQALCYIIPTSGGNSALCIPSISTPPRSSLSPHVQPSHSHCSVFAQTGLPALGSPRRHCRTRSCCKAIESSIWSKPDALEGPL